MFKWNSHGDVKIKCENFYLKRKKNWTKCTNMLNKFGNQELWRSWSYVIKDSKWWGKNPKLTISWTNGLNLWNKNNTRPMAVAKITFTIQAMEVFRVSAFSRGWKSALSIIITFTPLAHWLRSSSLIFPYFCYGVHIPLLILDL